MAERIVSKRLSVGIFALLIGLTYTTYRVSFLHLGRWGAVVAVLIALVKASLVTLFFMHAWHSTRLTRLVIVSGLFWLSILMTLVMTDYLTRGWTGM